MHYLHHVPGRLRVRSQAIKRNEAKAAAAERALAVIAGVIAVEANPLTGSIKLTYDHERVSPHELMAGLQAEGLVGHYTAESAVRSGAAPSLLSGETITRAVAAIVLEKIFERSALALVAAII
jgi:hypothetical protein